jgi:hypothetical protein
MDGKRCGAVPHPLQKNSRPIEAGKRWRPPISPERVMFAPATREVSCGGYRSFHRWPGATIFFLYDIEVWSTGMQRDTRIPFASDFEPSFYRIPRPGRQSIEAAVRTGDAPAPSARDLQLRETVEERRATGGPERTGQ